MADKLNKFDYKAPVTTKIYTVKHNQNLFAVMSKVVKENAFGQKKHFVNFVAEASTKEEADAIASQVRDAINHVEADQ